MRPDDAAQVMEPEHPATEVVEERPAPSAVHERPEVDEDDESAQKAPRLAVAAAMYLDDINDELQRQQNRDTIFASWWCESETHKVIEIDLGQVDTKQLVKKGSIYVSKKLAGSPEVSWRSLTQEERMQFETAMVKELDQVLQEGALRAATLAEITGLNEAELMQQRWVLTWKRDDSLHLGQSTRLNST